MPESPASLRETPSERRCWEALIREIAGRDWRHYPATDMRPLQNTLLIDCLIAEKQKLSIRGKRTRT